MFIKNTPLEATKDDPFKNDKLGREENIFNLEKIMRDVDTPLVMTVSASWGSGKSSFVRMWKADLEKEGHPCIMFNAWEHDFTHQPFLDFMGEIYEYMDQDEPKFKSLKKKFNTGVQKFAPLIEDVATIAGGCFGSALIGKITGKTLTSLPKLCANHKSCKEQLKKFKDQDFPEFIQLSQPPIDGFKPFYFFVDELDRCEPSYAIALLETINHIFNVKGIVFVLAVDKEKLGSMATTRYGLAFDADGYLERFIDVEYNIPEPHPEKFITYLIEDVYKLNENEFFKRHKNFFIEHIVTAARELHLTPRNIETYFCRTHPLFKNYREEEAIYDQGKQFKECGKELTQIYVYTSMAYIFKNEEFKYMKEHNSIPTDQHFWKKGYLSSLISTDRRSQQGAKLSISEAMRNIDPKYSTIVEISCSRIRQKIQPISEFITDQINLLNDFTVSKANDTNLKGQPMPIAKADAIEWMKEGCKLGDTLEEDHGFIFFGEAQESYNIFLYTKDEQWCADIVTQQEIYNKNFPQKMRPYDGETGQFEDPEELFDWIVETLKKGSATHLDFENQFKNHLWSESQSDWDLFKICCHR